MATLDPAAQVEQAADAPTAEAVPAAQPAQAEAAAGNAAPAEAREPEAAGRVGWSLCTTSFFCKALFKLLQASQLKELRPLAASPRTNLFRLDLSALTLLKQL